MELEPDVVKGAAFSENKQTPKPVNEIRLLGRLIIWKHRQYHVKERNDGH